MSFLFGFYSELFVIHIFSDPELSVEFYKHSGLFLSNRDHYSSDFADTDNICGSSSVSCFFTISFFILPLKISCFSKRYKNS